MGKVVCFGEALVDLIGRAPERGEPPCYEQYAGGAPANVATAVARLGGESAFVGMLARDAFGEFLLESLEAAGVDTRHAPRTGEAQTALAFVSLAADGERSFSFYREKAADQLFRTTDFDPACVNSAAIFHVCSNSLTTAPLAEATFAGMRVAREAGAIVSFDVNLRENLWAAGADPHGPIHAAIAEADLVKLARSELDYLAKPLGGEARFLERLWQGRARLLVVTDGAGPLRFNTRAAAGHLQAYPVRAIDTTAAGDAFAGGFLHWLAGTASPLETLDTGGDAVLDGLRFAVACGALAVTRRGSFAAMPSNDEVRDFLKEHA